LMLGELPFHGWVQFQIWKNIACDTHSHTYRMKYSNQYLDFEI
jgi:hypothetical protein